VGENEEDGGGKELRASRVCIRQKKQKKSWSETDLAALIVFLSIKSARSEDDFGIICKHHVYRSIVGLLCSIPDMDDNLCETDAHSPQAAHR
jgi:hypothetical protein